MCKVIEEIKDMIELYNKTVSARIWANGMAKTYRKPIYQGVVQHLEKAQKNIEYKLDSMVNPADESKE